VWKVLRNLCRDFYLHFQVLWLTPLLKRCCLKALVKKKSFNGGVLADTARFLRFFLLRNFAIFSSDGITDFGIAPAKHCKLVFCSFLLQIDWLKPFLTEHAMTRGVNGLTSFICLWCNARIVAIWRKVLRFHHTLPFMTKQRSHFGYEYLQTAQEVTKSLILNRNHGRTSFAASTQIVSFSQHLCSRRNARVDKLIPWELFFGKVTSKKYICMEQNRKYLHSVVITKTGRKSNLQKSS